LRIVTFISSRLKKIEQFIRLDSPQLSATCQNRKGRNP
jgi:hypothetical protein